MTSFPIYGYETSEALSQQYDVQAASPHFQAQIEYARAASATARASLPCWLDRRYEDGTTIGSYDLFFPAAHNTDASMAAVFYLHGGYWDNASAKDWSYLAQGLTSLGRVTAVAEHTPWQQTNMRDIVLQLRTAFAHFYRHARESGVSQEHIVIAGHGCGAHAAAMLLDTDWPQAFGLPVDPIAGALSISGWFDLRPLQMSRLKPVLGLSDEEAVSLSPQFTLPRAHCPQIIAYGNKETAELERQSVDYGTVLHAAERKVEILELPHDHLSILDELASPQGALAQRALSLATGAV